MSPMLQMALSCCAKGMDKSDLDPRFRFAQNDNVRWRPMCVMGYACFSIYAPASAG